MPVNGSKWRPNPRWRKINVCGKSCYFYYYFVNLPLSGFSSMSNQMENSDRLKNDHKWVKMAAKIQDGRIFTSVENLVIFITIL